MDQRNNDIDFVVFWVDGSDPAWLAERRQWAGAPDGETEDGSAIRSRDWGTLRHWLRSAERFAPWVRRIHLVTWGHLPAWLDTSAPKLRVVRHRDFIPAEYLPTFNSLAIGLNLHRIEGLAEQFVVFNDDMFLTRPCRPDHFFRGGLPCDMARLCAVRPSSIGHIIYNDLELLNARWSAREVLRRHAAKWFSPRYGVRNLLKSLTLAVWSFFPGIFDPHLPQPYLRRQWFRAWGGAWGERLDATCRHRLRSITGISDYLVRYDMLCRGEFAPLGLGDSRLVTLADDTLEAICRDIERQRWRMVCLNDSERIADFDAASRRLREAFERILPQKSVYER
ncbi:stealth family protein [Alistipes sp.]|uniref:stealth family protein n=1 Tax=Alistipes sp. TaxID=1872444 RepID=UPI000E85A1CB|nr:stealth family protein [Alistipes sp.]HBX90691.1 hypothetical protein [Alistipes sp.]